jgi:hypothetical protein
MAETCKGCGHQLFAGEMRCPACALRTEHWRPASKAEELDEDGQPKYELKYAIWGAFIVAAFIGLRVFRLLNF